MNPKQSKRPYNKNRPRRRHHSHKSFEAKLFGKWDHFFQLYLNARQKYFRRFDPFKPETSKAAEKNFFEALKNLRAFEQDLKAKNPHLFKKFFPNLNLESDYSKNHGLSIQEEIEIKEPISDPHLLPSQKKADYSSDTEEGVGTLEDYKKYKGLA